MNSIIRLADEKDAAAICGIYEPFVTDNYTSFEAEPPTAAEMQQRIAITLKHYPWLVCEHSGEVLGYAYAGRHSERAAYAWSVDTTVYIDRRCHRSGMGRALYHSLFATLRLQGFCNAYAGVALPNAGSVGLHEAMGFEPVGVYRKVGYKLGQWHDVGWWQLTLQPHPSAPAAPLTLAAAIEKAGWQESLSVGLSFLKL